MALPLLTPAQAQVLAAWSFGMMVTQSCGLTTVALFLARLRGRSYGAQRQQLRDWCYDAADKRGHKRREVDVAACFAPLLRWVLAAWPRGEKRLALALDATTLGQRFTVLAVSVVYRGCAIPVAWAVLPATTKGKWRPHWEALLRSLDGMVPADWLVIVLADRGLYARWLYQAIARQGWHPFLRINQQGQYRPAGSTRFRPLATVVRRGADGWSGAVECFASSSCRLNCTLVQHHIDRVWKSYIAVHAESTPWSADTSPVGNSIPLLRGAVLSGAVDGAAHRPLAGPDRSAAGGRAGRLVWDAGLD